MGFDSLLANSTRRGRILFWMALAGLLCLLPLFFVGGPGWSDGPLIKSAWNLGHPLFFALLALVVQPWRYLTGLALWLASSIVVLLIGIGIEYAQSFNHQRNIDSVDLLRNLTGLWLVLALLPCAGFLSLRPFVRWLVRLSVFALLAADVTAVCKIAYQQYQVSQWLPDLYNFNQQSPETFWKGDVRIAGSKECGELTDHGLSIGLKTHRYSGASLRNPPADWHAYDSLRMVIWNPQHQDIALTLRINDREHEDRGIHFQDRFNHTFQIQPGVNRVDQDLSMVANAPVERTMNMDNIRRLMLFTSNLEKPARLCLVALKLTKVHDATEGLD
ncbi:succinyl-CoA synthetase subunit beta [Marinobacter sp. CHS3-4]|uniref:succinyl-CoA synthetase subunit beta n=1 Tax=Marinobacter sp. CHS3-4 TaxID=3045174 RepID=UPI0024B5A01C|nr:succinyl-CoA synthetase subunit beta [Marinobacter sp. CHS3-4]MDI9244774.1 succinyl-CoA synthetase subunit beta [Marinobacter sp. CHS3-4]